jgi:septal ring factor EnvC (AmiA/AmiB activator)
VIDEAKLKRMQTRAQIAALASLVVFLVLIAFSASRLITLKGEVADVEQELAAKRQELEDVEQELAEAERKVEVHRELYGKMAQEDPGLARTATAAVLEADPEAAEILPRRHSSERASSSPG